MRIICRSEFLSSLLLLVSVIESFGFWTSWCLITRTYFEHYYQVISVLDFITGFGLDIEFWIGLNFDLCFGLITQKWIRFRFWIMDWILFDLCVGPLTRKWTRFCYLDFWFYFFWIVVLDFNFGYGLLLDNGLYNFYFYYIANCYVLVQPGLLVPPRTIFPLSLPTSRPYFALPTRRPKYINIYLGLQTSVKIRTCWKIVFLNFCIVGLYIISINTHFITLNEVMDWFWGEAETFWNLRL